jgi:hypothetical protein
LIRQFVESSSCFYLGTTGPIAALQRDGKGLQRESLFSSEALFCFYVRTGSQGLGPAARVKITFYN